MTNDQLIFILLIVMAIVLTFELIYILVKKKRRKEEMNLFRKSTEPVETLADKAHNAILTTESISSTLARQGVDIRDANELIHQARKEMATKDYASAIERADAAKLVLLRAKRAHEAGPQERTPPHPDPGRRPMNTSIYEPEYVKPPIREEKSLDSLPANYIQAKFMISTTKDLLEKRGLTNGEAYDFYTSAVNFYNQKDYAKALSQAIKAEKLLDSGTLTLIGEEKPAVTGENEIFVCPGCESEVLEDDAFCRECGQNLAVSMECRKCGSEYNSNDKFCRKCGQKLR
ncbi:MAG: zinc ribbon domain-containing protein [Candidatus Thermoplasmatota archaeon]|nr:zinc ribbon domain-containing protein [Euryarchaeota archaeon]MBU4071717.1 zinc ribbon domain-containing protein [Candidatus Thermoplasmatota archaeon]MBU4143918.1 zinc ribbon domain-containing protein [Candidatus Thermoplasmatota archaeon]MBU4591670.1 zinc ribbon domain-containing protein [Candidatus Thermoplasmatota archaeon]